MSRLAALLIVLTLAGTARAEDAPILVMGDSMMASNGIGGQSVGKRLSKRLGVEVQSRAMLGAWMIYRLPLTGAMGFSIPRQFRGGSHQWIVMNGGGNDLWLGCGCNACDRTLHRLAAPDGRSGAVLATLARLRASGAQVLYVGYLRSPGFDTPIEHCKDEAEVLDARVAAFAEARDGIHFLSLDGLVPEGDKSFHAADLIHPSLKGSDAIAGWIAAFIRAR